MEILNGIPKDSPRSRVKLIKVLTDILIKKPSVILKLDRILIGIDFEALVEYLEFLQVYKFSYIFDIV